jgi:hypothetical protein
MLRLSLKIRRLLLSDRTFPIHRAADFLVAVG